MAKRVVGVRFRKAGRMYYFSPGELTINENDGLIVETAYGIEYGDVVLTPRELPDEQIVAPLKEALRVATEEDRTAHERNMELEADAFGICQEKIAGHNLDMKLVDVEYSFNGSKITFFFTAEGRVDFRELVKDLAYVFKTRIELRQIGVRDEAKMLGGLGSCGRPVCCKTFLTEFAPVSIKMAKEQKLSLSPTKISGLCGRLMCCLKYEQDSYESMRKLMPRANREVFTPDGKGMVLDNNVITERTKVRIVLPDGTADVREYHYSEVRKAGTPEDEAGVREELIAIASARNAKDERKEEEFRFVTGAAWEAPAQAPAVVSSEPEAVKPVINRQNRRKPRRRPEANQDGASPKMQPPAVHAGTDKPRRNNPPRRDTHK